MLLALAAGFAVLGPESDDLATGATVGVGLGALLNVWELRDEVPRDEIERPPLDARVVGAPRVRPSDLLVAFGAVGALISIGELGALIDPDAVVPAIVAYAVAVVCADLLLLAFVRRWERRHGTQLLRRVSDDEDEDEDDKPELYAAWGVPVDPVPRT